MSRTKRRGQNVTRTICDWSKCRGTNCRGQNVGVELSWSTCRDQNVVVKMSWSISRGQYVIRSKCFGQNVLWILSKLHYLPYTARLSSLNIPTLSCRRSRIDLCTVFRILHHFTNLNPTIYFTLRLSSVTRGHPFTLCKPPARLDL